MAQVSRLERVAQISPSERMLLLLPLVASGFVGLFQLLLPQLLAALTGYSGNDLYIYRLSGAATFGYTVALALALRAYNWAAMRLVIVAFFTFGIASLYACAYDIVAGIAQPVVYVVLVLTIIFVAITGTLLYLRGLAPVETHNIARWVVWFLVIATVLAATFGLLPLFASSLFSSLFGLHGTDGFIIRQAGAATLGYAVMGLYELRTLNWTEMRYPIIMALVFNGLSFLASLVALASGGPLLLAVPVALASLGITIASIYALRRNGQ